MNARQLMEEAKKKKGEELTKWEKIKVTAPIYATPILIGATTIMCILGVNMLNKKHQASIMSAYGLLDRTHKEYQSRILQRI